MFCEEEQLFNSLSNFVVHCPKPNLKQMIFNSLFCIQDSGLSKHALPESSALLNHEKQQHYGIKKNSIR